MEDHQPYSGCEFISADPRTEPGSRFKQLMLCLMTMQGSFDENSTEDLEAYLSGSRVDLVVHVARGSGDALIPAWLENADRLKANHRRILDLILAAHPATPLHDNEPNDPTIGQLVFLPMPARTGHEELELGAHVERTLLAFLQEQGIDAGEAAALIRD